VTRTDDVLYDEYKTRGNIAYLGKGVDRVLQVKIREKCHKQEV
jgi:hypothetical protein